MMKRLGLIVSLCFVAGCSVDSEPEYFEGVVHIEIEVDTGDQRISQDLLGWWFGSTVTWTLKDGNQRMDFANADRASVWYRVAENREYQLRSCNDYITSTDASTPIGEIVSVTKLDETRMIAGYTTHALEVRTRSDEGTEAATRYWYAPGSRHTTPG